MYIFNNEFENKFYRNEPISNKGMIKKHCLLDFYNSDSKNDMKLQKSSKYYNNFRYNKLVINK